MSVLTFEEFVSFRVYHEDLSEVTGVDEVEGPGYTYYDESYIEKDDEGKWYCFVDGEFISTDDLAEAEQFLYEKFYLPYAE